MFKAIKAVRLSELSLMIEAKAQVIEL